MNLYIRFIFLLLKRLFVKAPLNVLSPCHSQFRVNILDLDLNLHMNNGRYLSVMDLGRFDLLIRAKVFWLLVRKGYFPVVASQSIRFKKSLGPFQSFELITVIDAWDDKDFYIKQTFVKDNTVYAEGYIKGRFLQRGRKGSVPTREVFELLEMDYEDGKTSNLSSQQKAVEKLLVVGKTI